MSDNTKQTNFRVAPETADRFREFCEQNGMTQAQGFDHLMQILEMDKAKAAVPGRQTEIEEYEKAIKTINSIYLQSLDLFNNAEDIAKEQFRGQLESKDNSISNLQDRLKQAIEERNQALSECDNANERAEIAEKRAIEAETERDEIKQNAINMENLSNYFEEIQKSMNALQGSIDSKKILLQNAEQSNPILQVNQKPEINDRRDYHPSSFIVVEHQNNHRKFSVTKYVIIIF